MNYILLVASIYLIVRILASYIDILRKYKKRILTFILILDVAAIIFILLNYSLYTEIVIN